MRELAKVAAVAVAIVVGAWCVRLLRGDCVRITTPSDAYALNCGTE